MQNQRTASGAATAWASALFGALLLAVPWWVLPVCNVGAALGGAGHHGCHPTLWLLSACGVTLLVTGLAAAAVRSQSLHRVLGVLDLLSGILAVLAVTVYPGLCRLATMSCQRGTKPAVLLLGVLLLALGGATIWQSRQRR